MSSSAGLSASLIPLKEQIDHPVWTISAIFDSLNDACAAAAIRWKRVLSRYQLISRLTEGEDYENDMGGITE